MVEPASSSPIPPDSSVPPATETHSTGLAIGAVGGILAAAVGGLLAWGLIMATFPLRDLPEHLRGVTPASPQELQEERHRAVVTDIRFHAMVAFAALGGLAALTFTLAEGLAARRAGLGAAFAVLGLVIGAAAGWLGGMLGWSVREAVAELLPAMGVTVVSQVVGLGFIGLGIGLSAGLVHRRGAVMVNSIFGGLLGGALAGLLYPILTSFLLPRVNTEVLVPIEASGRLAWMLIACILIALTASGLGTKRATAARHESPEEPTL